MATKKVTHKTVKKTAAKKPTAIKASPKKSPAKKSAQKKQVGPKAKVPHKKSRSSGTSKAKPPEIPNQNRDIEDRTKPGLTRSIPQMAPLADCKCMQRRTKFYCYRLIQGAWQQVSGIGYPTKESCEEDNCLA